MIACIQEVLPHGAVKKRNPETERENAMEKPQWKNAVAQ